MTEECVQYLAQLQKDWERHRVKMGVEALRKEVGTIFLRLIVSHDRVSDRSQNASEIEKKTTCPHLEAPALLIARRRLRARRT